MNRFGTFQTTLLHAEYVENWSCQNDDFFGSFIMRRLRQIFGATFHPDQRTGTSSKQFFLSFL